MPLLRLMTDPVFFGRRGFFLHVGAMIWQGTDRRPM
jgi:hypothetical protein